LSTEDIGFPSKESPKSPRNDPPDIATILGENKRRMWSRLAAQQHIAHYHQIYVGEGHIYCYKCTQSIYRFSTELTNLEHIVERVTAAIIMHGISIHEDVYYDPKIESE
jgi:hypothetical protein